jgi:hypothetical protein
VDDTVAEGPWASGRRIMTPRQFVRCFVRQKDQMVHDYMSDTDGKETEVALRIAELRLPASKRKIVRALIDTLLTDAFYTVLFALEGEASLGGTQEMYSVRDESGKELAGGQLEGPAWELFQRARIRRMERAAAASRRRRASARGGKGRRRRRNNSGGTKL